MRCEFAVAIIALLTAIITVKERPRRIVSALVLVAGAAALAVMLLWQQPPVFSLSNSGEISASQGGSAANTINVTVVSGPTHSVILSASDLPSGTAAIFSPSSGNPPFASKLTLTMSPSTPTGSYTITVTGTCRGSRETTTFTLTVKASSKWLQPNNATVISYLDAKRYVGQNKTVEGTIVSTYKWDCPCSEGAVYLNFHDPSKGYFIAIISESDLRNFPFPPEILYRGKEVRITGIIGLYEGDPVIVVHTPSQIEVAYTGFSYSKGEVPPIAFFTNRRISIMAGAHA